MRALTGPRTREAAEAGLALETAIRTSLRDAIYLCERDPAFRAVESTARHLGIDIDGDDEGLPILANKMLRLMLERSEERERRARGHFSDSRPYPSLALSAAGLASSAATTTTTADVLVPAKGQQAVAAEEILTPVFASMRAKSTVGLEAVEEVPTTPSSASDQIAATKAPSAALPSITEREPALPPEVFDNGFVSISFDKETVPAGPEAREPRRYLRHLVRRQGARLHEGQRL